MGGVEEVAVELEVGRQAGNGVGSTVERVADDGVAEGLHVDADLVGATSLDADFDEGEYAVGGVSPFEDVDVRDGGASVGAAGGHASAADEVAGDGEGDGGVGFFDV